MITGCSRGAERSDRPYEAPSDSLFPQLPSATIGRWTTDSRSRTSPTGRRPRASRRPPRSPSDWAGRRSGPPTMSWSTTPRRHEYGRIYEAILTLAWVGARHPRPAARDERDRRPAAERGPARQGARDARRAERRPGDRGRRGRLEPRRVREPRRRGPVPRPGRLPRRDDRAVASPLGRLHGAVPRPVPHDRRLRVRATPRARRRAADRGRRSGRGGPAAGRRAGRRLSLERVEPGGIRRARARRSGLRPRRPDARHRGSRHGSGSSSARRPTAPTRCAARPRRSPPRRRHSPATA